MRSQRDARAPSRTVGDCSHRQTSLAVLHIPKAGGTSFSTAVARAACPGIPQNWTPTCEAIPRLHPRCVIVNATVPYGSGQRPYIRGYQRGSIEVSLHAFPRNVCCPPMAQLLRGHRPIGHTYLSHGSSVVFMMRRPRQRLLSAFYAGMHVGGERHVAPQRLAALYSNVTCPAAFARFAGVANCQTKLLVGCMCGAICGGLGDLRETSNATHVDALRRARAAIDASFLIVLTEAFDLSLRMLRSALGLPASSIAVGNVRPGVASRKQRGSQDAKGIGGDGQSRHEGGNHSGVSSGGSRWEPRAAGGVKAFGGKAGSGSGVSSGDGDEGQGGAYDERELELGHVHVWSPTRPWTECRGVGVHPLIAWDVPTHRLEALDERAYSHGVSRFWQSARQLGFSPHDTPRLDLSHS